MEETAELIILTTLVVLSGLLLFGIVLWLRAGFVGRRVCRVAIAVQAMDGPLSASDLPELDSHLAKIPALREQWLEFKEGLVQFPVGLIGLEWSADQRERIAGQVPVELSESPSGLHNSLPVTDFFTDEALVNSIGVLGVRFPVLHTLPTVATSIGVLGTFVGVTLGLSELNLHSLGASEDQQAIQQLVSSLGAAFKTSIMGVC